MTDPDMSDSNTDDLENSSVDIEKPKVDNSKTYSGPKWVNKVPNILSNSTNTDGTLLQQGKGWVEGLKINLIPDLDSKWNYVDISNKGATFFMLAIFLFGFLYTYLYGLKTAFYGAISADLALTLFSFFMLIYVFAVLKKGSIIVLSILFAAMYYSLFTRNHLVLVVVFALLIAMQIIAYTTYLNGKGTNFFAIFALTDLENFVVSIIYFISFLFTSGTMKFYLAQLSSLGYSFAHKIFVSKFYNYIVAAPWWTFVGLFAVFFIIKVKDSNSGIAWWAYRFFILLNFMMFIIAPFTNALTDEAVQEEFQRFYEQAEQEIKVLTVGADQFFEDEFGTAASIRALPSWRELWYKSICYFDPPCYQNLSRQYVCEPITNADLKKKCISGITETTLIFDKSLKSKFIIKNTAGSVLAGNTVTPTRSGDKSILFSVDIENVELAQNVAYTCNFSSTKKDSVVKEIPSSKINFTGTYQQASVDCSKDLAPGVWDLTFLTKLQNVITRANGLKLFLDDKAKILGIKDQYRAYSNVLRPAFKFAKDETILRNKKIDFDLELKNNDIYDVTINNIKLFIQGYRTHDNVFKDLIEIEGPITLGNYKVWSKHFTLIPTEASNLNMTLLAFSYYLEVNYDIEVKKTSKFRQI